MDPNVTLLFTRGPLTGRTFVFNEPTSCSIGRSRDCTISLPQEAEHLDVSRHHCVLEIVPPAAVKTSGALRMIHGVNEERRSVREFGLADAATQHAKGLAYQMRRGWQRMQGNTGCAKAGR